MRGEPEGSVGPEASGLRVSALRHAYGRAERRQEILRGVELAAMPGQAIAVMGASGSGKSTLLHALGGMLRPDSGRIALDDVEPWRLGAGARAAWRNSQIGFVFQFHHLLAELSALENVLAPGWIAGQAGPRARRAAAELLGHLGLADRLHGLPSELSGGEAQRVAVARALILGPRLVLADEPTGNLDRAAGRRVFEELRELQGARRFVLVVATHDEELAAGCDQTFVLQDGRLSSDE